MNDQTETAPPDAAAPNPGTATTERAAIVTVPLETPLARNGGDVAQLRLRRPCSGDLRGLSIGRLGQLDYDEVRKLVPRISVDAIIAEEVDRIDSADMIEIAGVISDFLFTARRKAEFQAT